MISTEKIFCRDNPAILISKSALRRPVSVPTAHKQHRVHHPELTDYRYATAEQRAEPNRTRLTIRNTLPRHNNSASDNKFPSPVPITESDKQMSLHDVIRILMLNPIYFQLKIDLNLSENIVEQ